jgi:aryl-alcohol dehydrogenase-like predicted oxidoreductase
MSERRHESAWYRDHMLTAGRYPGSISLGAGLQVPRLGFGAMRVTGDGVWGEPRDPGEARRLLQRAVALGVRFIDTADAYGPDVSERLIAEALHPYEPGLVIATKGGLVRPDRPSWDRDGRPAHLRAACEASLVRLRLDCIDLYQLHAIDPRVPLEESLGELARLQAAGKIRHVGVSNFDAAELERARRVVAVVSVQNRYNVADRSSDAVLAACERDGMAFIPWSPLAQNPREANHPARQRLAAWAARRGTSIAQASIAWLLARSPAMLPIPGTAALQHLEDNIAAAALPMTAEELAAIG